MRISKRLKEIANFISEEDKIIDVGCDHALLDIYLKETMPNIKIIASDIQVGAINAANKNIEKHELTDEIDLRLGDGLDVAASNEFDTIVISGMGFN